ncbi:hypothetical protein J437_LFUL011125 [Ladona fulva]|uniref:tRNA (uracil-O(2)-)-methyltransferase n=1 Tax=Ladona fulva TaxID=123851 RepID=A0A8K0KA73_LADFU|nr:hypothetical protein J437_LFUL011125 [Ladona fulva]
MGWVPVKSFSVDLQHANFWNAVDVWNRVPHVLNRRICGVEILLREEVLDDSDGAKLIHAIEEAKFSCSSATFWKKDTVLNTLKTVGLFFPLADDIPNIEIVLKKLLPKDNEHYMPCLELEILDHDNESAIYVSMFYATCEPVLTPHIPYRLALLKSDVSKKQSYVVLSVFRTEESESLDCNLSDPAIEKSVEWLKNNLLPKFCKWAKSSSKAIVGGSLRLIPIDEYNSLYQSLKAKYASPLIKMWPESTDPKKFIHEDLGIAAYLLLLWKSERQQSKSEKMQTFVDVGCGNGLLVYILNEEGHPGVGVDVRSRQIWTLYPASTKLMVCTVNPMEIVPFPAADWLIGNHSDELTPWIPVIASMSSFSRFFVLPCCPYDFYGRYGRRNPRKSVYQEYLEYIQKEVCENLCQFTCQQDRLRIPSTKRICIVGKRTSNENGDLLHGHISPSQFLASNLSYKKSQITPNVGVIESSFVPRQSVEKVRNCTQIEKDVISEVVSLVAAELLAESKEERSKGKWNCGRKVSLESLAKIIPTHLLMKLKKESGGLQTLLRNNHFIFKVTGGMVEFRKPEVKKYQNESTKGNLKNKGSKFKWKSRPCWFHKHHPDGCPLEDDACSYVH